MQDTLNTLLARATAELPGLKSRADFEAAKARYVGPNGEFTALMKQMGAVPKEERPAMGKLINEAKGRLHGYLEAIPTALITDTLVALTGAAAAIEQQVGA